MGNEAMHSVLPDASLTPILHTVDVANRANTSKLFGLITAAGGRVRAALASIHCDLQSSPGCTPFALYPSARALVASLTWLSERQAVLGRASVCIQAANLALIWFVGAWLVWRFDYGVP